ncbi:TRAP transporter large permease subunit, partial [Acetomicrobium sp. S15 = DSM 107314]|uniref:TRAP transporter large permease subunit n=1 Tax=Acetomicrobium sp. S15 = DSM 107314 TaxID=2529858 RepID=UPI0018E13ACB
ILIGGILSGIFTPTEAAAIAAIYALILGCFVYREISLADLWKILKENPWMKDLFVEPKDVEKAQQDLTIKSTLIHKLAGKVIEMRGGSGA